MITEKMRHLRNDSSGFVSTCPELIEGFKSGVWFVPEIGTTPSSYLRLFRPIFRSQDSRPLASIRGSNPWFGFSRSAWNDFLFIFPPNWRRPLAHERARFRFPRPLLELLDTAPAIAVVEAEYRRLLGYPPGHAPEARSLELAAWARHWYADHGRPWFYLREVDLQLADGALRLDGVDFKSPRLREHLLRTGSKRAMVLLVSAGRACEERAGRLWAEGKPDEYFFLEMFGSAVVEHLVATLSGRICALADSAGLEAVPHYSPGYTGWDVAEQVPLFGLIRDRMSQPLPEPVEVLSSGMLRPKKSLLAVVGLAPATGRVVHSHQTPCEGCSFSPCNYRRSPYRHAAADSSAARPVAGAALPAGGFPPVPDSRYTVGARALRKWATERVRLVPREDGTVAASFRFDGTTCSNIGLAARLRVFRHPRPPAEGSVILAAACRPGPRRRGPPADVRLLERSRCPDRRHLRRETPARPPVGRGARLVPRAGALRLLLQCREPGPQMGPRA